MKKHHNERKNLDSLRQQVSHHTVAIMLNSAELCDEAENLIAEREYQQAIDLLFPLLLTDPPVLRSRARQLIATALEKLADSAHDKEGVEAELAHLKEWLQIDPNALYPLVRTAEILWLELDQDEEAYRMFQRAVEAHPYCVEAWLDMTKIALFQGDAQRALDHLQRAWDSLPQVEWAYPPYRRVIENIVETLYDATSQVLEAFGEVTPALELLREGICQLGHSDYLSDSLRSMLERLAQGQDDRTQQ